MSKRAMLNAKG